MTACGQLSSTTDSVTFADGTLKFLSSPKEISHTALASAGPTSDPYWFTYTNPTGVPKDATGGLFQFVWPGHATAAAAGIHHLFEMRKGSGTTALSAAYERSSVTTGEMAGGAVQFICPLSSDNSDGSVKVQYRLRRATETNPTSNTVFDMGHTLTMLGYM